MRACYPSDAVTSPEVIARACFSRDQRSDITLPPVLLVPVNDSRSSEAALHLGLLLAVPSKVKLVVVRIVAPPRRTMKASRRSGDADAVDREAERLETFVDRFFTDAPAKTEHELIVAVDKAAHRKIADLAAAHGAALIIMGASGDDLRRRLFGSIVEGTRRQAACPVVTIGARAPCAADGSGR
jgi:nucleotide-binding universal stress UspA family protein